MPRDSYRAKGWLRQQVYLTVARASPISAQQVSRALTEGGTPVHASAVFRAMGELEREGRVRRLESTKGYVPQDSGQMLDLVCRNCGKHREIPAEATFTYMRQLAQNAGFVFRHLVSEVVGLCEHCRGGRPEAR